MVEIKVNIDGDELDRLVLDQLLYQYEMHKKWSVSAQWPRQQEESAALLPYFKRMIEYYSNNMFAETIE